jgi:peptide/nickel transport system permease protein
MSTGKYLLKRLLHSIPLLIGAITIIFVLTHLAPGDPTDYIIGDVDVDQEFIDRLKIEMGLDKPIYVQLGIYLLKVASGDLGYSFVSNTPVLELILDRFPATLLLMGSQYVLSIFFGIGLGVISSRRPNSLLDNSITVFSLASFAIPVFWLGQMMILIFGYHLGWFPIQGMINLREDYTGLDHVLDIAYHLTLPLLTLTLYNLALILRLTRGSMLQVNGQDFIKVARSKGLSERAVLIKHALRNALLPVVTVIGLELRALIAGADF